MKLEEILPEIRKGRRFRPNSSWRWCESDEMYSFSLEYVLNDTWDLEPIKQKLSKEDIGRAWDKHACVGKYSFELFCAELGFE